MKIASKKSGPRLDYFSRGMKRFFHLKEVS
jgi:hypothetical protein